MMDSILTDSRLKSKIETLMDCSEDENNICYLVKFKDMEDSFFFSTHTELYDFLNRQVVERFYDKKLRRGYFDYINDDGETLRYHVEPKRGTLTLLKEENIGIVSKLKEEI